MNFGFSLRMSPRSNLGLVSFHLEKTSRFQAARLRRAWASVRLFYQQAEQDRSKVLTSDLDTMLGDTELRTVKQSFWRRYKLRFPAEVHPADATVSRVSREMEKRMLCVYNVWKVKSLQFQLHTTQRKRKLADGLYMDDQEEDEATGHDADSYLDRLHTLMLAYALAGSQPLAGAPATVEDLGADSTSYVAAPLDIMLAYYLRAKRTTMQVTLGRRLQWLQARDAEERAEWVTRYRESTLPLGQIVKEVFAARDAHWLPMAAPTSEGPAVVAAAVGGSASTPKAGVTSQFALGKPINGRKVARVMKDGTRLCASFQHGQCKQKSPCPAGHHRCGLVVRGERTCGSPGHGAAACRAASKAWRCPEEEEGDSSGVATPRPPLMADLFAGPNVPLTKAFLFCGWRCLPVDWALDPSLDLADPARQKIMHEQLTDVDFIAAAFDCSTKSRAREIPRKFEDGRPAPQPLRSESFPDGLPNLSARDQLRVDKDNAASSFILQEIDRLEQSGGASVRENPYRSLHWHVQQEVNMWATGRWKDKQYASCVFAGARCKQQRLRHNLAEIDSWPVLACHHTHAANEWEPWLRNGVRVYPSAEEAEYTAPLSFAIAVAASWWACRMGRATLRVPRAPAVECVGRREHWLDLDPRSMRSWAMAPLAITLGLEPPDPAERKRVPRRVRVTDVLSSEGALPKDTIYVGRGHHSHRLPTTKWKSPWTPGHDCSHDEWLILYVDHICHGSLWDQLHDLCEADMLAGLAFEASTPVAAELPSQAIGRHSSAASLRKVVFASALHQARSSILPRNVVPRSQESVILCFQKLFPADWFLGFKFPMIEDLVNQPPFNDYPQWLSSQDVPWDGPLGPQHAPRSVRLAQRMTEAQQSGALAHRAALPPLLPFGLDVDEHFRLTRLRAAQPLPTEGASVLDPDLHFAAWQGSRLRGSP